MTAQRQNGGDIKKALRRPRTVLALATATLAAAVPIGVAFAADSRLDLADDHIERAIALVEASQNPNAKDPDHPFGNHDTKAAKLLEAARAEIAAAKAYADDPQNWVTAAGQPTQSLAASPGPEAKAGTR